MRLIDEVDHRCRVILFVSFVNIRQRSLLKYIAFMDVYDCMIELNIDFSLVYEK